MIEVKHVNVQLMPGNIKMEFTDYFSITPVEWLFNISGIIPE